MEDRERGEINSDILKNIHITQVVVLDVLKRIKVYPGTLWEAREVIAGSLAEIATVEVPEDWRVANVVPLFKKGDKEKPGNYRPVSLTSVVWGMVSKFTDDANIAGVANSEERYLRVQLDGDQMGQWAEEWQMEFNLDKCEVLHFGKANQGRTYTLK
eukprot:g31179.t1